MEAHRGEVISHGTNWKADQIGSRFHTPSGSPFRLLVRLCLCEVNCAINRLKRDPQRMATGKFLFTVLQIIKAAHANQDDLAAAFWYRVALGSLAGIVVVVVVFVVDLWISDPRQAPEVEVFVFPIVYLFRESVGLQRFLKKLSDPQPGGKLRVWISRCNQLSLFPSAYSWSRIRKWSRQSRIALAGKTRGIVSLRSKV